MKQEEGIQKQLGIKKRELEKSEADSPLKESADTKRNEVAGSDEDVDFDSGIDTGRTSNQK